MYNPELTELNLTYKDHIMGIDPGYRNLGWGIANKNLKRTKYGLIQLGKEEDLYDLYKSVDEVVKFYKPKMVLIEKIFFNKNAHSAINIAKVQGMLEILLYSKQIEFAYLTPQKIKKDLTGVGKVDKKDMISKIQETYNINNKITEHEADALAAIYSFVQTQSLKK